jgi:uncharacterized iron-regulated protein
MPRCAAISRPARPRFIRCSTDATLAALGLVLLLAGPAASRPISTAEVVALPPAGVVILGEVHDNPAHHLNQARVLGALKPAAVVFEMLSPEQAAIVNDSDLQGAALAEAIGWADSGWPDFAIYQPVFDALGTARVYGMALPRDEVRRAMTDGAAAVFGAEAGRFGLAEPLRDDARAELEDEQREAHCNALPPAMLPGMVEAQRLRDAAFARTVLEAYEATGGPVVVITGNGHAREDWGIPHALRLAAPELVVLSLGQLETGAQTGAAPYALWLTTPAAAREDPCAVFRTAPEPGPTDSGG